MKVQISLDDKLMERIDSYADENYMTRSGLVSFACTQFLNQNDALRAVKEIVVILQKVADEGKLDDDTLRQMEDIERILKFAVK